MEILVLYEGKRPASYFYYLTTSFRFLDQVISLKQVFYNLYHLQGKVPYYIYIYIYIYMSSLLEREQRKGPRRYKDRNFVSAVLFSYFFFSFPPLYMSFCLKALAGKGKNFQRKSPHLFSQQCIQAVYLSGI